MWKTQLKIGQSRHPNTLKLCRYSYSFVMKRKLMGRRVNATLFNLWEWDKIIQGPWRNQKYRLQKTETTLKSKDNMSAQSAWLALRRDWAGTGSEGVNASPRLALTRTLTHTWEQRHHTNPALKQGPRYKPVPVQGPADCTPPSQSHAWDGHGCTRSP